MDEFAVQALSHENLSQAQKVISSCFPYLRDPDEPSRWLGWSLDKARYQEQMTAFGVLDVNYYVAIDTAEQKVVGVTGLYVNAGDREDALWMGWTGVEPSQRGRGTGGLLLHTVTETAREAGKSYLRVFTSSYPDEATAVKMYEKRGFKLFRSHPIEGTPYTMFYLELRLSSIDI